MRITKFTATNCMNLKNVEIIPEGNLVMITGKNAMGKSSILDTIDCTLRGVKFQSERPIRDGEESAESVIETESLTIKRTWTGNKTKLTVLGKNKAGDLVQASKQQGLLDDVVGKFAMDPMEFIRLGTTAAGKRQQRELLMKQAGLDFSDIDARLWGCKEGRTKCNTAKAVYDSQIMAITIPDGTPNEEVSVAELSAELGKATQHNASQTNKRTEIENIKGVIARQSENINSIKKDIEVQLERLRGIQDNLKSQEKYQSQNKSGLAAMEEALQDDLDTTDLQAKIDTAEATNTDVRNRKEKLRLGRLAMRESEKFQELGTLSKNIEAEKSVRLAKATMPVAGLSVDDDGVTYNGLPLYSNTNTAKQIEIAMAIAVADNPELRVIRISGNDLDSESLKTVVKYADENDIQCWMERIGNAESGGIYIEDGELK